METLVYFLFWAGLFFLMMRFGCGSHITGHHSHKKAGKENSNSESELRWIPPVNDVDPVCGKTFQTKYSIPSVYNGSVYYFCSLDCREQFEAAPHLYAGSKATVVEETTESAHG